MSLERRSHSRKKMAKPYFEQLKQLIESFDLKPAQTNNMEVKHFFSGAALYSEGVIISSLSPMGLSFKLPEMEVEQLIKEGKATYLKYFEKGNVKKSYAMFQEPNLNRVERWRSYFLKAIEFNLKNHI